MQKCTLLLITSVLVVLSFFPVSIAGQTVESALKSLNMRVQATDTADLKEFAPLHYDSIISALRKLNSLNHGKQEVALSAVYGLNERETVFEVMSAKNKAILSTASNLKNTILKTAYLKNEIDRSYYVLQNQYDYLIWLGENNKYDSLKMGAPKVIAGFKNFIAAAGKKLQASEGVKNLKKQQQEITANLSSLNTLSDNSDISKANAVYLLSRPGHAGGWQIGAAINNHPVIVYGSGNAGPPAPIALVPTQVNQTSISFSTYGQSGTELGNRLIRSGDLTHWETVATYPAIPKGTKFSFTDIGLQASHEYSYYMEAFNNSGSNRSQISTLYTAATFSIPLWRLQLRVKIANFPGAGSNNAMVVQIGNSWEKFSLTTLDYGHVDFGQDSVFTYDLNIGSLQSVADITNISLVNPDGNEMDIEEVDLFADNNFDAPSSSQLIFKKYFGTTPATAYRLVSGDPYSNSYFAGQNEIWNSNEWKAFIQNGGTAASNLPVIFNPDGAGLEIHLSRAQLASRIESFVGNAIHSTQYAGEITWADDVSGYTWVELTYVNPTTMHAVIHLTAIVPYYPDPSYTMEFDLVFQKSCGSNNTLSFGYTTQNFKSGTSVPFWKNVLSLGVGFLGNAIINAEAGSSSISESSGFTFPLPANNTCENLMLTVTQTCDVNICCIH